MLKFFEIERVYHDTVVRLYVEPLTAASRSRTGAYGRA
jgi:hypothetical protein